MSNYTDQRGNPVSRDEFFTMLCESILANVIAFDEAGVPRRVLKQIVGPDGGTIIGREMIFQTPVERRLSDEDGRLLFEAYRELVENYDAGRLDSNRVNHLKDQNNVPVKVAAIRVTLSEGG
jgi:hypothetical protein